jgi:DNA-binding transcriptional MocR family regulator
VIDDPHYFNIVQLLNAHRVRIALAPFLRDGPDLAALEAAFAASRPRVYLTVAGPHNPTGAVWSPANAHRALKLAERYDVIVIEDDIYGDFETTPTPRLASFDGFERVVQIGGFSKTVSAALRTGYIAARPDWAEALVDLKLATTLGNSALAASVIHRVLVEGGYRRHLDALRPRLANAMGAAIRGLRGLGLTPWVEPRAGLFLWAELPGGLDAVEVASAALEENVVLAPGRAFSPAPEWAGHVRFNAALSGDPRVFEALDRAMKRASAARRGPGAKIV